MSRHELLRDKINRQARSEHRQKFWRRFDRDAFECEDCGRGADEVSRFEVHHRDGNPTNGDWDNLVGLCWECHLARHGRSPGMGSWSLDRWKQEFLGLGGDGGA